MSVLVIGKFPGNVEKFRQSLADRASEFVSLSNKARGAGAIHHRFGAGDNYVMIVDEWETPAQFEQFFSDPALVQFISEIGAEGPPEITVCEALTSSDQF